MSSQHTDNTKLLKKLFMKLSRKVAVFIGLSFESKFTSQFEVKHFNKIRSDIQA